MATDDDFLRTIRRFTEQATDNLDALAQTSEIAPAESLTPAFMAAHTRFPTIEAMLQDGPESPGTLEALATMSSDQRNAFVSEHSTFPTWEAMQMAAAKAWAGARFTQGL